MGFSLLLDIEKLHQVQVFLIREAELQYIKLFFDQNVKVIDLHYGHSLIIMFICYCPPGVILRVKLEGYHTF